MLRPVPSRPPGPVDPAEASRHVAAELSALDEPAANVLALVALAGRTRAEAAEDTGLGGEELGAALARARKALRRALHPLPGSGWCERSERMISDRIDDALEDPGPARLEAHLANCPRCVEHERRLAQAQDALVAGFVAAQPAPAPVEAEPEPPAQAPPALRVIDTPALPAPEPEPLVDAPAEAAPEPPQRAGVSAGGLAWGALAVLGVLLMIASIVLAVAGALGAGL